VWASSYRAHGIRGVKNGEVKEYRKDGRKEKGEEKMINP